MPFLKVEIKCDPNADTDLISNSSILIYPVNVNLNVKSKHACAASQINGFFMWVHKNRWALCPMMLILGFLVCFAGKRHLKPLIFIVCIFQATALIIIIVYNTFAVNNEDVWVGWVVIICSLLLGGLFGYVMMTHQKIGGFFLVAWGGFNTGLLFYNAFLYKIDSNYALWGFSIGIALIYALLLIYFFDHLLIHASAMIGSFSLIYFQIFILEPFGLIFISFCFVYGIGIVAGHYTNPFLIVDLIKYGQIKSVDPIFYAYFGGNLVLYLIGCIW